MQNRGGRGPYRGGSPASSRGGRGGRRGRGGYFGRPGYAADNHSSYDARNQGFYAPQPSFSLQDEARNTGRHQESGLVSALRHSKISFVSAGKLEGNELLREEAKRAVNETEDGMAVDSEPVPTEPLTQELSQGMDISKLNLDSSASGISSMITQEQSANESAEASGFVMDTERDPYLASEVQIPARASSPTPSTSSSSSEKIVFIPRMFRASGAAQGPSIKPSTNTKPSPRAATGTAPREPCQESLAPPPILSEIEKGMDSMTIITQTDSIAVVDDSIRPVTVDVSENIGTRAKNRRRNRRKKKKAEKSAAEDYIENIAAQMRAEAAEDGGESSNAMSGGPFKFRNLGGEDEWIDDSSADEVAAAEDSDAVKQYKSELWKEHILADLDILSTCSEGPKGAVDAVLGKRSRPSGLQYLIKWTGHDTDDATWVLADALNSSSTDKLQAYEEFLLSKEKAPDAPPSDDDSSGELDEEDENENDEANEDLDLNLARLLQTKNNKGVVESDMDMDMDGIETDIMGLDDDFFPMGRKKKESFVPVVKPNPRTGGYPSASRLADAYEEFDVMDWDRPSLNKKGKGKAKAPELNLSDSELEFILQTSWTRDRQKKKLLKQEREELRAQGILGRKSQITGKMNPKDKYKEGMTMDQLREEINKFIKSSHETLSLPPMDKSARMVVHQYASKYFLRSRSVGSGRSRFPILYKTSRFHEHNGTAEDIEHFLGPKRFLNRSDVGRGSGRGGRGGSGGRGGGGGHHREGDVVGAAAPELAADNRGRRMLEKMGYVTGMALGSEGNKGITAPVEAVVKMGKAGLG